MKKLSPYLFGLTGFGFILILGSSQLIKPRKELPATTNDMVAPNDPAPADLSTLCTCTTVPKLEPIVPIDLDQVTQPCFDCYGWQLFVAMNWLADPLKPGSPDPKAKAADFGTPGDYQPLVWETYKNVYDVFKDDGSKPSPWGFGAGKTRSISMVDKTDAKSRVNSPTQADLHWLTDWNGNFVYYEITLNEDEFNWIIDPRIGVYNKEGLYNFASKNTFNLPDNKSEFGPVGAMEIKAAWKVIPDEQLSQMKTRYKISYFEYLTADGILKEGYLALVGLHITKKTPKTPQWTWATFEHVDNAPDKSGLAEAATSNVNWNFFSRDAAPDYKPNYDSPPSIFANPPTPKTKPVQVVRTDAISETAQGINKAMHDLIIKGNPNSVFQYYNLVDVQWPKAPVPITGPQTRKLPQGDPKPEYVANITMETYLQTNNSGGGGVTGRSSCIGCHSMSAITPDFSDIKVRGYVNERWFTDYSAVFFKAQKQK